MSESGDYDPGPWRGHDFSSARRHYDVHVGRSYDDAVSVGKARKDVVPDSLTTDSESPLVIACDVTGSMGEWPATIFSKLPYLEHEAKDYLGKGTEISFAAVGDYYGQGGSGSGDKYPLQVRPFDKSTNLKKRLEELIIEGGGGGQEKEGYDFAALYYAHNVSMPKAIKPLFIFIGDEGIYDVVNNDAAKEWARVNLTKKMTTREAFGLLKRKFEVYAIHKPYQSGSGDSMSPEDRVIYKQWSDYLGADHIAILPEAGRVVDVIFGILAKEAGRTEDFEKEITGRQRPSQVRTVMKSLNSIHNPVPAKSLKKLPAPASRSVTRYATKGGTS
ncbi:MAG TPA: hypothetical protein VJK03_00730 [Candidatus Nanoarchaeia archaeon]|nr:hypothetical protein [Candidatus Nanoarchaeia archaeon]